MTKALEILKEIQQKKPFIYSITSVWCRTIITNEPTRINEAIAELEELMKPKSCEGCKYGDDDRYWLCLECVRFYKSDRYEAKDKK